MRQLALLVPALSALLLVACRDLAVAPLTEPASRQPGPQALAEAPAPTGGATLRIRWPERTAQYIPETAETILLGVYQGGRTAPIATGSVTRPASTFTFQPLPVGSLRFTAEALDPDGSVGASGSATVTVPPNATVSVPLHLASTTPPPSISAFSPANGVPGQQVTVTGANFGEARHAPLSVRFGTTAIAADRVFRLSETQLAFFVPPSASNATFSVTVGDRTTWTSSPFRVIATISVTPDASVLDGAHAEETLTLVAKDSANVGVANPVLPWTILQEAKSTGGTVDNLLTFDKATGKVTRGTATGTAKLGIGLAPVLATVSFTVQ